MTQIIPELLKKISQIPEDKQSLNNWAIETATYLKAYFESQGSIDDLYLIMVGLLANQQKSLTPEVSHLSHLRQYCISNGGISEFFHLLSTLKPKSNFDIEPNKKTDKYLFNGLENLDYRKINDELAEVGYAKVPFTLNKNIISYLTGFAENSEYSFKDIYDQKRVFSISTPNCVTAHVKQEYLKHDLIVNEINNNSILQKIATNYLNASVIEKTHSLWYSFPHPNLIAKDDSAQMYHYDLDGFKWLKCFIYLSDVYQGNGTHCFIPKTHIVGKKNQELLNRGYARIPDEDISNLQINREIEMSGLAGTIFFGDTKCYHKGKALKSGIRLLFQIEYQANTFSTNNFGD